MFVTKEVTISLSQRSTVRGLRIVVSIGAVVYFYISYRGCNVCVSDTGAVMFVY